MLSATDETEPYTVASASSDAVIRVWDLRVANKENNPLAEVRTESILTCLAGSSLKSFRRPKLGNGVTNGEKGVEVLEIMTVNYNNMETVSPMKSRVFKLKNGFAKWPERFQDNGMSV